MKTSRPFWIGTSWKMNKGVAEARAYARALLAGPGHPSLQLFVIPPHTAIAAVAEILSGSTTQTGGQDGHWEDAGALTGTVSIAMVREAGATILEIGHSERRMHFGETDAQVNRKVHAALRHGMMPLVCVGDTREERDAGAALESIVRQARLAFAGVGPTDLSRCLLAYEPVWAIGVGGVPATPETVAEAHSALRGALQGRVAGRIAVLYGGSVDRDNAEGLAALDEVDGLFIGRAALRAEHFLDVAEAVARVRGRRAGPV